MRLTQTKNVYLLKNYKPEESVLRLLPEKTARECLAVPLRIEHGGLIVACAKPNDIESIRRLEFVTRRKIQLLPAVYSDICSALDDAYGKVNQDHDDPVAESMCLRMGFIQPDHLPLIREKSLKQNLSFLESCDRLGLISGEDLLEANALLQHVPYLREKTINSLTDFSELLPWDIVQNQQIVPLSWVGNHLVVGSSKILQESQSADIQKRIRLPIQYVLISQDTWEKIYRRFYLRGGIEEIQDIDIAEKLVQQNLLTEEYLLTAINYQERTDKTIEDSLLELNLIDRMVWFETKAKIYKVDYLDLDKKTSDKSKELIAGLDDKISTELVRALQFIPIKVSDDHCEIGMVEPTSKRIRVLESILDCAVHASLVDKLQLAEFFRTELPDEKQKKDFAMPPVEEYALSLKMITPLVLLAAQEQPDYGIDDHHPLVKTGLLDDVDFAELQGLHFNLPFARLDHTHFSETELNDIPRNIMAVFNCFPLFTSEKQIWVATSRVLDGAMFSEIEKVTGKRVWPVIVPESIIQSVIDRYVLPQQKKTGHLEVHIIEKLVENGLLTQLTASRILRVYANKNTPLDVVITEETMQKPEKVIPVIAKILGISTLSLGLQEKETTIITALGEEVTRMVVSDPVDTGTAHLISLEQAKKWQALPISETELQVIVAFANLDFQHDLNDMQTVLDKRIKPVLVSRRELEEATQRVLGRRNLGTYLLLEGLITRNQLNRALDLAHRTGVRIGRALLSLRYITQKQLYQFIAAQSHLPFVDLQTVSVDEEIARIIPEEIARQSGLLPIQQNGQSITLAITDPLDESSLKMARTLLKKPIEPVIVMESDLDRVFEKIYSRDYLEKSVSELLMRSPEDSAFRVISKGQSIFFVGFLIVSAIWLYFDYVLYFFIINSLAMIFYLSFSSYKLYLIYQALDEELEVPVTQDDLDNLDESELPVYSVLVPVYHEAEILPDLLNALRRLDYPATKLDILILMEEDDTATVQAYTDWNPPSHFRGLVVPTAQPKTKPKACNYGLIHARGDYVVIFDAEDLPDADQLKKVIFAFRKLPPEVVCIQSKLNYYNRDQNLLTRWFTIEYSMWFDLFLPGLNSSQAPIPLGGTSNHFRRDALLEIGAWDPYNVTEDADLGIRLYKRGYKTAIVDSTTYEEANSKLGNWIRQRSRWIKGYMQTWLVHMRHPVRLWKEIGWKAFMGFQFVVGGNFLSALLNPIYWIFTTIWFLIEWQFIQQIFPSAVFYLGAVCLFFGNFAFTYINVAGAMRRNYYGMVKYALLSPFYWALASIAAWRGFLQLFRNPYYWEKTVHGLHEKNNITEPDEPNKSPQKV
jgi:cellulose synthase/poly-beta-1,6-N-acetylglucosamine synthase-like glycosyltransferase